ncbi:MAG: Bifunctional NMN adenylyltransferase/Nudix hydrolase [Alphaproteobacteria bacterium ADurb.Bin438]|nr:MAG: Bifunctional NMN adenylyltransferase/Nudix hydrolase [Alphaproteobacteria bacterium ADurb.Bin438]
MKKKHGLTIMRAQPFHLGHARIIEQMLNECEKVTVLVGSIQESGTERNPLKYKFRKMMIRNVYPDYDNLKIFGIYDIKDDAEWADYVLDFLYDCLDRNEISHYYAGSFSDAQYFLDKVEDVVIVDRNDPNFLITASLIRKSIRNKNDEWKKHVHSVNHQIITENINAFFPA